MSGFPDYDDFDGLGLAALVRKGEVSVVGMVPRWYHLKYYTQNLPTLAMINGEQFVANIYYFGENDPFSVTVGSTVFDAFQLKQDAVWLASEEASKRLIEAFRKGPHAKIRFASMYAKGGPETEISLLGFTTALNGATGSAQSAENTAAWPRTESQAIAMVAERIGTNKLKVTKDHLEAIKNPVGKGYFVYVPKTVYFGFKRNVIWFAGNGMAVKLNAPSDLVTPSMPWRCEASYTVFDGSNLDDVDITQYGISVVFGD